MGEKAAKAYDDLFLNKSEEWSAEEIAKYGWHVSEKSLKEETATCAYLDAKSASVRCDASKDTKSAAFLVTFLRGR